MLAPLNLLGLTYRSFPKSVAPKHAQHGSSLHWYKYGDTCSKVFFNFQKGCHKRVLIKELVANRNVLTTKSELAQYIHGFYECLYSTEPENERVCVVRTLLLFPRWLWK
jgi:hypothetical protein